MRHSYRQKHIYVPTVCECVCVWLVCLTNNLLCMKLFCVSAFIWSANTVVFICSPCCQKRLVSWDCLLPLEAQFCSRVAQELISRQVASPMNWPILCPAFLGSDGSLCRSNAASIKHIHSQWKVSCIDAAATMFHHMYWTRCFTWWPESSVLVHPTSPSWYHNLPHTSWKKWIEMWCQSLSHAGGMFLRMASLLFTLFSVITSKCLPIFQTAMVNMVDIPSKHCQCAHRSKQTLAFFPWDHYILYNCLNDYRRSVSSYTYS